MAIKKIKTQSVKKKRTTTKPKKSQAIRDAEKAKERKQKSKAAPLRSSIRIKVQGIPYKLRKFENLGARKLPESYYTMQGQSLKSLIRNTPRLFVNNAVDVEPHRMPKRSFTKGGKPAVKGIMWTNDPFRPDRVRRYHETYIVGLDAKGEEKPLYKHKRVLVQCTCLTGDTKVLTDHGWKTIFELAQPHTPGHYPINYNVKGELFAGTPPFYTGKKKVFKITLSNGQTLTGTRDHQLLKHVSLGNRKFLEKWTEIQDLKIGDKLLLNDFAQPKIERTQDYWEAFFIGVMQGDGTLFANGKPNLKLFGHKHSILKVLTQLDLVKDVSEIKGRDNGLNVQFTQRASELCHRYKFDNKRSVKLDTFEQTMGYLAGLVATDGTVYKRGDILIRGAKEYLDPLNWKLMEYGIVQTRLYREREAGVKTNVIQEDYGVVESTKEMWALRISNQAGVLKNLALSIYHRDRIDAPPVRPRKAWAEIVDISFAGKQHVYDITVPGPHRFAANGVIAHNCESYIYTYEYANAWHGAAYLIYSNGEPPVWMNPSFAPGMCKHLIALSKIVIENNL